LGPFLDGLPTESAAEIRDKQIAKQVPYATVATIPAKIHVDRRCASRSGRMALAICVRNELLMKWLTVLPWRQKNIRECRVGGPRPNLFKSPLDRESAVAKPKWVLDALERAPATEFWQFRFTAEETKVGKPVYALVPKQLIPLLEEYLAEYRPVLVGARQSDVLFPTTAGTMLSQAAVWRTVRELSLRYCGKRLHPHIFRHILAYAWLDDHPDDYLTLSKILWHSNINTTLNIYGARFDEANGTKGMETWLERREGEKSSPHSSE
jgi:hypothetical protein